LNGSSAKILIEVNVPLNQNQVVAPCRVLCRVPVVDQTPLKGLAPIDLSTTDTLVSIQNGGFQKRTSASDGHENTNLRTSQKTSCSLYLRSDFAIRSSFKNSFQMEALVRDQTKCGIVVSTFESFLRKDKINLCEGSRKMLNLPNAGGGSIWSEVISFEVLASLFRAQLLRTEMELEYWPLGCKITDYSVRMYGIDIGVSVTRALKYKGIFTDQDAVELLEKKLYGVNVSSRHVISNHSWKKQILFVWAEQQYIGELIVKQFELLSDELKSNTVIYVCVSKNSQFIYNG